MMIIFDELFHFTLLFTIIPSHPNKIRLHKKFRFQKPQQKKLHLFFTKDFSKIFSFSPFSFCLNMKKEEKKEIFFFMISIEKKISPPYNFSDDEALEMFQERFEFTLK